MLTGCLLNAYPMPIIVLLLAVVAALALSITAEAFPHILWGWIYWPRWLLWPLLLALLAWCIDDDSGQ
jgi:hypothetical protein